MAYDEKLAMRVRAELKGVEGVAERKMMGGLCFMVKGHMCGGVDGSDLFVRMDRDDVATALHHKYARPFQVGGNAPAGFVRVLAEGVSNTKDLRSWLEPAITWAGSLPPKKKRPTKK